MKIKDELVLLDSKTHGENYINDLRLCDNSSNKDIMRLHVRNEGVWTIAVWIESKKIWLVPREEEDAMWIPFPETKERIERIYKSFKALETYKPEITRPIRNRIRPNEFLEELKLL